MFDLTEPQGEVIPQDLRLVVQKHMRGAHHSRHDGSETRTSLFHMILPFLFDPFWSECLSVLLSHYSGDP